MSLDLPEEEAAVVVVSELRRTGAMGIFQEREVAEVRILPGPDPIAWAEVGAAANRRMEPGVVSPVVLVVRRMADREEPFPAPGVQAV